MKLLVVDDPALAGAIRQVEGEWSAQTGCDFRVKELSREELAAAETLEADAVICPSWLLGSVGENHQLAAIPERLLRGKSPMGSLGDGQANWGEVFVLLWGCEAVWEGRDVAVPFGSPVLTLYYRADLLEKLGASPPRTWAEYQRLAELLSDRGKLGDAAPPDDAPWSGAIEPLAPGWAGLVLLARAAPYATHRENFSALFNIDTMEPLVGGPPFVRALEELVAAASFGSPEQLAYDPGAVRQASWQGKCGMALTWPTAAGGITAARDGLSAGFAELPGSPESYNVAEGRWEPRRTDEDTRVPLLAAAGRIGVVPAASDWPEAAFQLLFWLSDEQSANVCPASAETTLFRSSHMNSAGRWVEGQLPASAADRYAELTQQTLCRPQHLFALRIPGRSEYLSALDAAVQQAVRGRQSPKEALQQASDRWDQITDRLGVEPQRRAYWNSLGLD